VPKEQKRRNANDDDDWRREDRSKQRKTKEIARRDTAASYKCWQKEPRKQNEGLDSDCCSSSEQECFHGH